MSKATSILPWLVVTTDSNSCTLRVFSAPSSGSGCQIRTTGSIPLVARMGAVGWPKL